MISTIKSVNSYISSNECTALNVEGYESVKEVFGSGGTIKSNKGDPELIIYVKFKEKVNISGILIESSMDTEKRPAIVKIYANKTSLDFADVETEPATEVININSSNIGKSIGLKIAKFRNISTLYVS